MGWSPGRGGVGGRRFWACWKASGAHCSRALNYERRRALAAKHPDLCASLAPSRPLGPVWREAASRRCAVARHVHACKVRFSGPCLRVALA